MLGPSRASHQVVKILLVLASWTAGPAEAQTDLTGPTETFDAHGDPVLPTSGDPRDALTIWSAFAIDPGFPGVGLVGQYAHEPLVRVVNDGESYEPIVEDLVGADLVVSAPIHRRFGLAAGIPVWLYVDGETTGHGPVAGDLRIWAPVRIWDPGDEGPAFALVPSLRLPTGAAGRYLGSESVGGGGQAAFGWRGGPFALSTQAGMTFEKNLEVEGWPGGPRADLGASFGWVPLAALGVHVEARANGPLRGGPITAEAAATVRGRPLGMLWWTAGVGHALTTGIGAASWRAYAGVGIPAGWPNQPASLEQTRYRVVDPHGDPIRAAQVLVGGREHGTTDAFGEIALTGLSNRDITVVAPGYAPVRLDGLKAWGEGDVPTLVLQRLPVDVVVRVGGDVADPQVTLTGDADPGEVRVAEREWRWAVPPGQWTITVSAPGMSPQSYAIDVAETRTEAIVVDAVLAPEATPGGRLVVQVRDLDGHPVQGATVRIGERSLGTTGTGGEIAVDGFPTGSHAVAVEADGYASPDPVAVRVGSEPATAEIVMAWLPGTVRFLAFGPDGRVTDALVVLRGPEERPTTSLGADGEALMRLRPGAWTALVSSPTLGAQERAFDVTDAPGRVETVSVVLQPLEDGDSDLAITVYDPDGTPVEGARITLDGQSVGATAGGGSMTLLDLAPGRRALHVDAEAFEPADRAVALTGGLVAVEQILTWKPGAVRVSAVGPDQAPVDAVVGFAGPVRVASEHLGSDGVGVFTIGAGSWEVAVSSEAYGLQTRGVVVPEGATDPIRVDVVMQPFDFDGGSLRVAVTDPAGEPAGDVEALLDGRSLGRTSNVGTLTVAGLPAGAHDIELRGPGYAPVRDTVRIHGDTDAAWQLSWGPGAVEVIVRGPEGPVDALLGVSGPRSLPPVRVGADGTRVLGLDPGTWWILASSASYGAQEQQVDLPDAPGLTTVEFVLGPVPEGLAVLLLRVRDPEGGPVGGAAVTMGRRASGTTSPSGSWLSPAIPPAAVGIDIDPPAAWRPGHLDVVLEDGSQERITMLPWRTGAVVVDVTDPSGAPVAARVWFEGPAEAPERALAPGEKSAWELRPGEWTAWASASGLGVAQQTFTLEANDRGRDVHLVLAPPVATLGAGSVDVSSPILFDLDRAAIRTEAMPLLAEIARTLVDHPEITRLEIQGHTDDSGGAAYNQTLSERRARAVRQALIERGVPPERLVAKGYGQSRPVTPNVDAAGRAANRRVEFVILERTEVAP